MKETKLKQPKSMDELMYFSRRTIMDGRVVAWAFKPTCPECGEDRLEKPTNPKTGKKKTRSSKFVCESCGYEEKKKKTQERATINIHYICPHCEHEDDTTTNYKRRTYLGKKSFVFKCDECWQEIPITKRVKRLDRLKTKKNPKPPE